MKTLPFLILLFLFSWSLNAQTTVLNYGATWNYLDNNSTDVPNDAQGDDWNDETFDDSAWSSGPAQLGYGDGDESTVVLPGTPDSPRTAYFRSTFDICDPTGVTSLDFNLIYDDGAVIYLNGIEIHAVNMPAGRTYATFASGDSGDNATTTYNLNSPTLNTGTNTVAVEVHQLSTGSSDISFDLEIVANGTVGGSIDDISGTVEFQVIDCLTENPNDYGHPAILMELYEDGNSDGDFNDPEDKLVATALTDKDGNYTITDAFCSNGGGSSFSDSWDYVEITGSNGTVSLQVAASTDDAEEDIEGGNTGEMFLDHAVISNEDGDAQHFAMRFGPINPAVPEGATITNGQLELLSATGDDSASETIPIYGELTNSSSTFSSTDDDISSRTRTSNSTNWSMGNLTDNTWYSSPDISNIIEEIVGQSGYTDTYMTMIAWQTEDKPKEKNFQSYDDASTDAPKLSFDWSNEMTTTTNAGSVSFPCCHITSSAQTISSANDAEEQGGVVDITSNNLEMEDGDTETDQTIGLRFEGLNIPQGADVKYAYIQFTADADGGGTGATSLTFTGEDVDNALAFTTSANNITDRLTTNPTSATVAWNSLPTWVAGDAIGNQHSPDLETIIQEIVDRPGFNTSSAISLLITGTGSRIAESADGVSGTSPELVVVYEAPPGTVEDYIVKPSDNNFTGISTTVSPTQIAGLPENNGSTLTDNDFILCGDSPLCYAMDDQVNSGDDRLVAFNRINGEGIDIANPAATAGVEAIVFNKDGTKLWAYNDNGLFGYFNPISGVFTPIGTGLTSMDILNNDDASSSAETIDDVDGLALRSDGNLWASVRDAGGSQWDFLIVIDTLTGTFIPDAFGVGVDGVRLYYPSAGGANEPPTFRYDVDDIALDPSTGLMYVNVNAGSTTSYNCTVNVATGELTYVNEISFGGAGLTDIEGFTFTSNGLFYVTTGNNGSSSTNGSAFYIADINTGVATDQVVLLGNVNGGEDGDYEGCDCLSRGVAAFSDGEIGDFIFVTNVDAPPTGNETPIPGVVVNLYRFNGLTYDLIEFTTTDVDGEYLFESLPAGTYQVEVAASNYNVGGPLEGATQYYDPDGTEDDVTAGVTLTSSGGGITSDYLNDFGYYSSSLPVDWLSFDAAKEGRTSVLMWKTGSEIDNARFDVQRSRDGIEFKTIGSVEGNGTSSGVQSYSFVDQTPLQGINYYRLEQIDYDGSIDYSPLRSLTFNEYGSVLIIPNPTSGLVSVTLAEDLLGVDLTVNITDAQGKLVKVLHCNETCDLDISDLVRGMYQFTIVSGQQVYPSVRVAKL